VHRPDIANLILQRPSVYQSNGFSLCGSSFLLVCRQSNRNTKLAFLIECSIGSLR
jgi:hypothetical protein